MSNAIVSLILVALMIVSGMSFSKTAINAFDEMTTSWQQAEKTRLETLRSDVTILNAAVVADRVNVYLKNAGQISQNDYENWDIIVQYYDSTGDYFIKHLTYAGNGNPGSNQWAFNTIYANEELLRAEVFQPGILDPGEAARVQLNLVPAGGSGTLGWVILATTNGITTSTQFQN